MGSKRTAYHVLFGRLLVERAPPDIEVHQEVSLGDEPQRMDYLLLRRKGSIRRDHLAQVLRGLWPLLSVDTIVEFKSAVRPPTRGDLIRLDDYAAVKGGSRQTQRTPYYLWWADEQPILTGGDDPYEWGP